MLSDRIHLTKKVDIEKWLARDCTIQGQYTIHDNGCVDVEGSIKINNGLLTYLPITFGIVTDTFKIDLCRFVSLEGSPRSCRRFICDFCSFLQTLEGGPTHCQDYSCFGCGLIPNLIGSPDHCFTMDCSSCNRLTSFEGLSKTCKSLKATDTNCLNTLQHLPESLDSYVGTIAMRDTADHSSKRLQWPTGKLPTCLVLPPMVKPSAEIMRTLLTGSIYYDLQGKRSPWLNLLRKYKETGDILEAAARFETVYKQPLLIRQNKVDLQTPEINIS